MALFCGHCNSYYNPADPRKILGCNCPGAEAARRSALDKSIRKAIQHMDRNPPMPVVFVPGRRLPGIPFPSFEEYPSMPNTKRSGFRFREEAIDPSHITIPVILSLDKAMILQAVNDAREVEGLSPIPSDARVSIMVPGGGDRSSERLDIDREVKLDIQWGKSLSPEQVR